MSTIDDLITIYRSSVAADLVRDQIGEDIAFTISTVLNRAYDVVDELKNGAHLKTATGLYLDLHGRDRDMRRQSFETQDQFRERLRVPQSAVTPVAILDAVQQIIGDTGSAILIEIPRHAAFCDRGGGAFGGGFDGSFCDRGLRLGGGRGVVIVLIPSSANAMTSVSEAVRMLVSAGKIWLVEEYT